MKFSFLFSLASFESPSGHLATETVIKFLHSNAIPKVYEIWRSAALEYENAEPAVKVRFGYLEDEEFEAKLPALLQPKVTRSVPGLMC